MQTNMNPEIHAELKAKGQALLSAARDFWEVHQPRIRGDALE
jgi:hypothetical protein